MTLEELDTLISCIADSRHKTLLVEEIDRMRVNEKARIATVRKWAAERVEMVDHLEMMRLKLDHCDEQSKQLGEALAEIERLQKITADHAGVVE